jgi:hypothetical protein
MSKTEVGAVRAAVAVLAKARFALISGEAVSYTHLTLPTKA